MNSPQQVWTGHALKRWLKNKRFRRLRVELLEARMCLSLAVPAFSSLPGANHTIYLDFDGHVTTGTTWNSGYYKEDPISSPAWSLDSDRTSFSTSELATIQRIWQRVAEDFSPFHVNVTTVEPSVGDLRKGDVAGDTKWGVRAVVTIETTSIRCGCGGIAYIGSFNDLYDEPVFIYNTSETGVAEAISHEVGHSLYLAHDGTFGADGVAGNDDVSYYAGHGSGETSWAPIMGTSYYRNVTTWDRGEYYNTNNGSSSANYGNGPDDLRVITTKNGFGYRSDDHGDSISTATPLVVEGTAISGSGIITTRTDVDVFSFTTGAGAVALAINPVGLRPNLDIQADLLDAAGNLVASSNPASALNASFSLNLAAGTYYLRIDGVGVGDPSSSSPTGYSDYSSIGQFTVAGNIVDAGTLPTISVADVSVSESEATAGFVVRISGTLTEEVTVSFATANGSAVTGSDFTGISGTLTFRPGEPATQTVNVAILPDTVSEPTEVFYLQLSNVSPNAMIADGEGVASITNDDVSLSISNTSVTEPDINKQGVVGKATATVTVSLAHPVDRSVAVNYGTNPSESTATAGVDCTATSGTLVIPAGQTSASIPVTILGDNILEGNETVAVRISSTDPDLDDTGVITIIDNDTGGNVKGNNASGKGGGKQSPSGAHYEGDFTTLDHADPGEWTWSMMDGDYHHHHDDHDHDHDLGEHTDDHAGGNWQVSGGDWNSSSLFGYSISLRQSFVGSAKSQSLRESHFASTVDSSSDLLVRLSADISSSDDDDSLLTPERSRKVRSSNFGEQNAGAAEADALMANLTDWLT